MSVSGISCRRACLAIHSDFPCPPTLPSGLLLIGVSFLRPVDRVCLARPFSAGQGAATTSFSEAQHETGHPPWLVGHAITPGAFRDPIQKIEVRLEDVANNPRIITSGHIVPLDRGGRHVPENTSLILKSSNDLQGNNTVAELLDLIQGILRRHGRGVEPRSG